jgi:hypothetical protein
MPIVALYAALFAIMLVALSVRVILVREANKVSIGDGGHKPLQRAIRVQGNFTEYVPLALVLFWLVETSGASALWVHGLCATLLVGRFVHAIGVSQMRETLAIRVVGMLLTFTALLVGAGWLLVRAVA